MMFKRVFAAAAVAALAYGGTQTMGLLGSSAADLEEAAGPLVESIDPPAAVKAASGASSKADTSVSPTNMLAANPDALAQVLLLRSGQSLDAGKPGIALLQFGEARALAPDLAASSPVSARLDAVLQREGETMHRGLEAASRRNLAAVHEALAELRTVDKASSSAIELTLAANAALEDRGGSFSRIPHKFANAN